MEKIRRSSFLGYHFSFYIFYSASLFPTVSCVCFQPAVAVGNVGQLAVDLLVSTLNMSRVGYMHTDCLIPMAGNNPYGGCKEGAEELHTPAEGRRALLASSDLSHLPNI